MRRNLQLGLMKLLFNFQPLKRRKHWHNMIQSLHPVVVCVFVNCSFVFFFFFFFGFTICFQFTEIWRGEWRISLFRSRMHRYFMGCRKWCSTMSNLLYHVIIFQQFFYVAILYPYLYLYLCSCSCILGLSLNHFEIRTRLRNT